jgi:hypothetical protein
MDIEHLITQRFKHLMNCSWKDFPERKNMFETYIHKLRKVMEAGDSFTIWSHPYVPSQAVEYGYRLREYCSNDLSEGVIERLLIEELTKRGLAHSTIMEAAEPVAISSGIYTVSGMNKQLVLEEELLPCDEFLGHPIYRHEGMAFTIESVRMEDAPVNNVGGGNIAGVSPGQEPPGKRGMYFARNLKKTKDLNKKLKRKL